MRFLGQESQEFVAMMNGHRSNMTNKATGASTFLAPSNFEVPPSVDWRKQGYVTPIKNQVSTRDPWGDDDDDDDDDDDECW